MSNLAYHSKGLKVKKGLFYPKTNYPLSGVTTPDYGQLPLELKIVHRMQMALKYYSDRTCTRRSRAV